MALEPGHIVDRYTVQSVLGEGGMAVVYLCRHNQLGTPHALKVLTLVRQDIRERLIQEGRVQAQLRHPNIVAVTDVFDLDGVPGLLMELVQGPSLDELLQQQTLSLDQVDVLALGILDGAAHAHAHGLVHRDLKPANIMLSPEGATLVPKITDFGLAKVLDSGGRAATRTGSTMGTPNYMSPEQVSNTKNVDHRTDVFALGAILYEMVCGQRAFDHEDLLQTFNAVAQGRFTPPRELRPQLPERMEAAILGALQPDRERRAPDVEALRALWTGAARDDVPSADGPFGKAFVDSVSRTPGLASPTFRTGNPTMALDPSPEQAATWDLPSPPESSLHSGAMSDCTAPVAGALGRARRAQEPAQLHDLSWFALEAALKIGAAARIALWVQWADGAGDPRLSVLARPSLAHWAGLYRDLGRALALGECDHPLARAQLARHPRPAVDAWLAAARSHDTIPPHHVRAADDLATVFDAAVTYRSRVIGHGARRSEAFLAELGPLLQNAATALVEGDDLLGGLPLDGTKVGDLELTPLLALGEGGVGLLDKFGRSSVTYLDYSSGETFEADTASALGALAGERAQAAEASDHPHNLPRERDAFVGRVRDLAALTQRLHEGPLVSVLGIGGTGKTRLALRAGWDLLGAFPGGVWFCDLSDARSIEGIASSVAKALDVPLGKGDPIVQLGHAIAGRGRCLLLLDNFEQVARYADATLGRWLDRAHEAHFVVTSREVLGLPGEQSLPLAPLPVADAVDLFCARARAAKPGFVAAFADRPHIEALVALLDRLPLAIELAAARSRVMSPETLLDRMSQRFRLLTSSGGRRDRQATLRGALDWSWDLLSDDEQTGLAQLSVFEGGFTLDSAGAVLELAELWPEDLVQALVDKSLVRVADVDRFDLLVSVQEYAAEKLKASGDRAETEARHGAHFATYGTEDAIEAVDRRGGRRLRAALTRELDNLLAASRRAVARQDGPVAVHAALAAWSVLQLQGPYTTAIGVLDGARATATRRVERMRATLGLALALYWAGRMEAPHAHFEAALAMAREAGNRLHEARVLDNLGSLRVQQGRFDEARAHYDAALAVNREVGNRGLEGTMRSNLGILHLRQGRLDEARTHFEAALAVHREVGNRRSEGVALGKLSVLAVQQGRLDEARVHFDAALAVHREVGDRRSEGVALGNLGILHSKQGRLDEARAHFDAAVALHREVGDRRSVGVMLGNLGILYGTQGRLDEAHAHHDAALALHREVGNRLAEGHVLGNLGNLYLQQGRMDQTRASLDLGEQLLRGIGADLELGKLLCSRARLCHAEGDLPAARAALAEVEALLTSIDAGPDSELGQKLTEARAVIEQGQP